MTFISTMSNGSCDAVIDALRAEFGAILAQRILEAEAADFLWFGRVKERYLGQHFSVEDGTGELSRVAILSVLDGRWHVGVCLVDGEGMADELLWRRLFENRDEAEFAFDRAA
jgi:hypothetical protein